MITWCFFGQDGRRALTTDQAGGNLPQTYAPWNSFRIIELTGSDPKDAEIAEHVRKRGFYIFSLGDATSDA